MPARYLSAAEGTASVLTPYNTQEVAGQTGEMLTVIERDDESGWHWCRNAGGQ